MNAWHRHNGGGNRRLVQVLVCFSLSLSPSFVPRMGSVWVPGRISMRQEGGGDGGQGGGAVGELELAQEVCHTINGRMKNSHIYRYKQISRLTDVHISSRGKLCASIWQI